MATAGGLEKFPEGWGVLKAGGVELRLGGLTVSEPKFCEKILAHTLNIYFQIFRYLLNYNEHSKKLLT